MSEAASVSAGSSPSAPVNRALFVVTILTGSFLLFLVQPMVARMALPRLGGAPNVWNSAMLVYQALLLAGYAYAHRLSRMALKRQAQVHIALLLVAALTLPITLAQLAAPSAGSEALWVPLLFLVTIGPVFFLVSAQAPLMQRWFSSHPGAGEPWALYAASNLGSFAGLIAYPLLLEPNFSTGAQSLAWSLGYGALIVLIALAARARWQTAAQQPSPAVIAEGDAGERIGAKRILLWLALSAIPSGLLLSTTTHLTTDVFAMPLLWVIPLGLYLLSFVSAFSDRRVLANAISASAPLILLLSGGMAMATGLAGTLSVVLASVALLYVIAVALHSRMYDLRPGAEHLTLFYLVMSAGGALGGLFTALIAPLVFDWVWEHPLLVLASATVMPLTPLFDWRKLRGLDPSMAGFAAGVLACLAALLAWWMSSLALDNQVSEGRLYYGFAIILIGMLLVPWRWLFAATLALLMVGQGGFDTIQTSIDGARTRSYFGIYTVRDDEGSKLRRLTHGTTLHGQQSLDPGLAREPMTYYGRTSGIGLPLVHAGALFGDAARIGVVGLGTGTLACYKRPGQTWRFYEIDPAVLDYSRDGTFTYLSNCAPDTPVELGDARIELESMQRGGFDLLAIDAFSSDAIPLHLLTDEAFAVYLDKLDSKGLLVVHISNRYIELEPVIAALARKHGLTALKRDDNPANQALLSASTWVAMARDPAKLAQLQALSKDARWSKLPVPAKRIWTDDHSSILPFVRWKNLVAKPS